MSVLLSLTLVSKLTTLEEENSEFKEINALRLWLWDCWTILWCSYNAVIVWVSIVLFIKVSQIHWLKEATLWKNFYLCFGLGTGKGRIIDQLTKPSTTLSRIRVSLESKRHKWSLKEYLWCGDKLDWTGKTSSMVTSQAVGLRKANISRTMMIGFLSGR